jgi:hypothetical protein
METLRNYLLEGCTYISINAKRNEGKKNVFGSLFSFMCISRHTQSLLEVNVLVFIHPALNICTISIQQLKIFPLEILDFVNEF